jgi:hypothetical protein
LHDRRGNTESAHQATRTANSGPSNARYSGSAAVIARITPAPSSSEVRRTVRAEALRSAR